MYVYTHILTAGPGDPAV